MRQEVVEGSKHVKGEGKKSAMMFVKSEGHNNYLKETLKIKFLVEFPLRTLQS
jgi:hypothetical protein